MNRLSSAIAGAADELRGPDLMTRIVDSATEIAGAGPELINILIVDDEPANLVVLETVLDDPGYRLVRAPSADQALLALMDQEFALLILDVRMPGMTGFELAHMIKGRRKTADVPIIFLTAFYDKDQHVIEGYGTGAVDFLSKPVNPTVLRSKVSVFADLHRKSRAITLANRALLAEVNERRRAEEQLRDLNENLERRVAERTEALRRADDKLRVMMSSITDGLLMLDTAWRFTYVNEQGSRLLGKRIDQLLGSCIWELFPQMIDTPFSAAYHRAVQSRQTVSFEAFFPDPLSTWLECHFYPSDEGLSVYVHDISDRREVEVRREHLLSAEQAARTEGERIARAKEEFLATLSHELRTPLAAIVGWANILQRPDIDADTARRGIAAIARNAQSQAHLISDLLDMSRFVSGKIRLTLELVDLNSIASATADNARPAALSKELSIHLQLDREAPLELLGDAARLQQIATNLVTNAVKFTPGGGAITIATAADEAQVELTVSDTGQGIEAQFLPHLFDRFSQADGSAARLHGGLGLGLSIVKHLVELQGGTVTASSAGKGAGASFKVTLPRAKRPAGAGEATKASSLGDLHAPAKGSQEDLTGAEYSLQAVSVLLVDDNNDVLEVERRLLCEHGASVTTAISAAQGLQLLQDQHFDVLLSDLGMPAMDGYDFIRRVRGVLGRSANELPAAAVTAFVRPEDQTHALQAGFQACIQKPVVPSELIRTVISLCAKKAPTNVATREVGPEAFEAQSPARAASRQSLRALFVEDNVELQEQIGWQLEEEGLILLTCSCAEDAMREFDRGHFDVVVTDVSLPGMSGVEFARWIVARSPETWVVFSSGYSMSDDVVRIGHHVRALLKPFEALDLQSLMEEVRADLQDNNRMRPERP